MHAAYCVGYHWEKGNVKGFVWSCVFAILSGGLLELNMPCDCIYSLKTAWAHFGLKKKGVEVRVFVCSADCPCRD